MDGLCQGGKLEQVRSRLGLTEHGGLAARAHVGPNRRQCLLYLIHTIYYVRML